MNAHTVQPKIEHSAYCKIPKDDASAAIPSFPSDWEFGMQTCLNPGAVEHPKPLGYEQCRHQYLGFPLCLFVLPFHWRRWASERRNVTLVIASISAIETNIDIQIIFFSTLTIIPNAALQLLTGQDSLGENVFPDKLHRCFDKSIPKRCWYRVWLDCIFRFIESSVHLEGSEFGLW